MKNLHLDLPFSSSEFSSSNFSIKDAFICDENKEIDMDGDEDDDLFCLRKKKTTKKRKKKRFPVDHSASDEEFLDNSFNFAFSSTSTLF